MLQLLVGIPRAEIEVTCAGRVLVENRETSPRIRDMNKFLTFIDSPKTP
jgi:hypothetical protein